MPNVKPEALQAFAKLVASRMGSREEEAEEVADHLVRANLAGHDSHGVGMLPTYVRLLGDGLLVPNQTLTPVWITARCSSSTRGRGFGQRMAADAVRAAMGRAKQTGAAVLGLRNSAHIGRIGTYGELAAAAGMAFVAFVNVADHHPGKRPMRVESRGSAPTRSARLPRPKTARRSCSTWQPRRSLSARRALPATKQFPCRKAC